MYRKNRLKYAKFWKMLHNNHVIIFNTCVRSQGKFCKLLGIGGPYIQ